MAAESTATHTPQWLITRIVVGTRYRHDLGDVAELAKSIRNLGLLHPVVVTPDGHLIAGQRRLEACRKLGWAEVPVHVVPLDDLVRGEHDENAVRKDFLPSEMVAIAQALAPKEREAAKKRQVELGRTHGTPSGKLPEGGTGQTRDKVAAYAGVSGRTLEKAAAVVEAAAREPEKYGHLLAQMDDKGHVNGVYKRLVVAQKAEAIAKEPPPLPVGPFRVLVVDPPWNYNNRAQDLTHRAANPFPPLSVEELGQLPVGGLAHPEGAILWLWTTNAFLHDAFHLLDAWGFTHKTMLTWVKDRMGTGDWLRGQTEHCLLAIRGKPVVCLTSQTTLLQGPLRDHSRKPEAFYALVEQLCPGSKLELFARQPRPGWTVHGDEVIAC